ncbi:GntR family transcriptional regulator [Crenalkalicoccus roseus]|uniref:GntR family transcriptional regulator n=1 Tax=Crenalkalicoccus roseus TaxID=1485588 RepID=UPI001305226B|nr:GntR family transcriptional regulator [Crenalkalicoccus roseus]
MAVAVRGGWAREDALAGTASLAEPRRLLPVQPRTMVEQAAEAIVAAAARGVFLPGDRLVEAEIARDLGISRVPVREALRLLESQGIVVSTPYKGMRLMQVSNRGVAEVMRVRLALETLAVTEALRAPGGAERFAPLRRAAEAHAVAAGSADPAEGVAANEQFHAELCRASGNAPLLALWQSLARQLAVIWGLARQRPDAAVSSREHLALVEALERGDAAAATGILSAHVGRHCDFDYEAALRERRRPPR